MSAIASLGSPLGAAGLGVRPAASPMASCYVAPSGSDANPGTKAAPWRTLAHAQAMSRPLLAASPQDVAITLRGGTYYLPSPLALTSADSGRGGNHAVWQAYPGETPVISGGMPIAGPWTRTTGTIWRAACSPAYRPRAIWYNGVRCTRARAGSGLPGSPTLDGTAGYAGTGGFLDGHGNPTDIEMVYRWNWLEARMPVGAIGPGTIDMVAPGWPTFLLFSTRVGMNPYPTDVENAYEIFAANAAPGTFYLDRTAGQLYLIPPDGSDPGTATVVVPVLEMLLAVGGDDIIIRGLTFSHTTFLQPSTADGFSEVQANAFQVGGDGDYSPTAWHSPPAAVLFSGAHRCRFTRNVIRDVGGAALSLRSGAADGRADGNLIRDVGGDGIMVGAADELVEGTARNVIANNAIHDWGREFRGACGVVQWFADGTTIKHNLIHHGPYTGISVGWGWTYVASRPNDQRDGLVGSNLIHHPMQVQTDGACIYLNGRHDNFTATGNVAHDDTIAFYLDEGAQGETFRMNVAYSMSTVVHINGAVTNNLVTDTTADSAMVTGGGGVQVDPITVTTTAGAVAAGAALGAGPQPGYLDLENL